MGPFALPPWLIYVFGPIGASRGLSRRQTQVYRAKLNVVNEAVYDWWYLDAVSDDGSSSITICFSTSPSTTFPFLVPNRGTLLVYIWASFPSGKVSINAVHAQKAVIETSKDGYASIYLPVQMGWQGSADFSRYRIFFNNPKHGIKGTVDIRSVCHPSSGRGAASRDVDVQVCPHVGWANAIPDGNASVDMAIAGSSLRFHGTAYHDKVSVLCKATAAPNILFNVYCGRTRIGLYSVFWSYVVTPQQTKHVSAYVAVNGKIRHAACFVVKYTASGGNSPLVNISVYNSLVITSAGPSYTHGGLETQPDVLWEIFGFKDSGRSNNSSYNSSNVVTLLFILPTKLSGLRVKTLFVSNYLCRTKNS
ncbi:hypothetical protein MGYG_00136 [Nannizzia gypsea CBS 118893]|uniref:Uncharacterized protein n=1 Tax=Arthroderma gypseum (strain ATCC MYA-4604 / CBS 118893) TaxID=535722 RepID=E5R364_ARTGP|nr:hypothetical protein MGYG_00136 [Nannizzia gypsea CBS 118893]EFQ97093.1 hypothetical protein MGYG_00136 [Nannizzia gypsea CBS 118893]